MKACLLVLRQPTPMPDAQSLQILCQAALVRSRYSPVADFCRFALRTNDSLREMPDLPFSSRRLPAPPPPPPPAPSPSLLSPDRPKTQHYAHTLPPCPPPTGYAEALHHCSGSPRPHGQRLDTLRVCTCRAVAMGIRHIRGSVLVAKLPSRAVRDCTSVMPTPLVKAPSGEAGAPMSLAQSNIAWGLEGL